jgi:hypothetical protein
MDSKEILHRLLQYGRPEILKEFRADSCIASTAIGLDVLTYFGVLAEPLPVKLSIFNAPYVKRIDEGSAFPNRETLIQWGKEDGSYIVGIGYGTQEPNKWAGHLVLLVENKWLADLSIDQANRPNYNMVFAPFAAEVDADFLAGKNPRIIKDANGCVIRIETIKSRGFLSSPDWTFVNRRKHLVNKIIQKIKENNHV